MTNISATISWSKSFKGPLCSPCSGYDYASNVVDYIVSVSLSIGSPWTMNKLSLGSGACYYMGQGDVTAIYSVRRIHTAQCCDQSPAVVLTDDVTTSGTFVTDGCLTVKPWCDPGIGDCSWRHELRICNFPLENIEWMEWIDGDDCFLGLTEGEEPLARHGLWLTGCSYSWLSTYENLATITLIEYTPLGWLSLWGVEGETACDQWGNFTETQGPFSIALSSEWSSDPESCNPDLVPTIGSWTDCGENQISGSYPVGDVDYDSTCCNVQFAGGINPPLYA